MADEKCSVTIWPTEVIDSTGEPTTRWHWKRVVADGQEREGAQLDGSGPQRNGLPSKKAALKAVKEKYPDDKIT